MRSAALISIVDDDESMRESTKGLVRSLGYQATAFVSAEEFLQVQMPGLSGIDLQSWLIDRGIQMPTIFITAFPDEGTRLRAATAGAVGYLDKPFSEESLIRCLDTALGSSDEKMPQP